MKQAAPKIILIVGVALLAVGLYRAFGVYSVVSSPRSGVSYQVSSGVWRFILMPLIPGAVLTIAGLLMGRSDKAVSVIGPGGEKLNASAPATNQCPHCGTSVPEFATVCSQCGAEKAIGRVGKLGLVGPNAVWPMRIVAAVGWMGTLMAILSADFVTSAAGWFFSLVMLAVTLFNWRVIFWDGTYRWYRRSA